MELWIGAVASLLASMQGLFLITRSSAEARLFSLVAFSASAYVLVLALLFYTRSLLASHLVIACGAAVLVSALFFALSFRRKLRYRDLLLLIPMLAVAATAPTGLFVAGVRLVEDGIEPVNGPLIIPLAILVLGYCAAIWYLLVRAVRSSKGRGRVQAVLILLAFSVILSSVLICNVLAPIIGITTANMVTGLSLIAFVACVTYALCVERLFGVQILVYRAFVYGIGSVAVLCGILLCIGLLAIAHIKPSFEIWLLAAVAGAISGSLFADLVRARGAAYFHRLLAPALLTPEQEAAQAAERRLVADIAHGLQTPLAVLRAEVEGSDDAAGMFKARVVRSVDELSQRMRDLISFARAGMALTPLSEAVRFDALVSDIVEYVDTIASERSIRLEADISEPVYVQGRPDDLRTLITNLLSNALEYAPRGSGNHAVFISLSRMFDAVSLTIADTGPGMSEEERLRACEPLYRASGAREGRGMGLGLAIARQVALTHGGTLSLAARDGGGIVALVTLPVYADEELLH